MRRMWKPPHKCSKISACMEGKAVCLWNVMAEAADFQSDRLSLNYIYSLIHQHKKPKHSLFVFFLILGPVRAVDFYFHLTGCSLARSLLPSCLGHKQSANPCTENALMAN